MPRCYLSEPPQRFGHATHVKFRYSAEFQETKKDEIRIIEIQVFLPDSKTIDLNTKLDFKCLIQDMDCMHPPTTTILSQPTF